MRPRKRVRCKRVSARRESDPRKHSDDAASPDRVERERACGRVEHPIACVAGVPGRSGGVLRAFDHALGPLR
ncbi:MAG: hypothetical protein K8H88_19630 [Sandaracinaceae bacterium]|nr:hypothetical protein [Sandaracinaceae bacterium]